MNSEDAVKSSTPVGAQGIQNPDFALMGAVWNQDAQGVRQALAAGANPLFDEHEPLRVALVVASADVCEALLAGGAQANANHGALVKTALKAGADNLFVLLAEAGGLVGWDCRGALLKHGKSEWLLKEGALPAITPREATNLLKNLPQSRDKAFSDLAFWANHWCDKGANAWLVAEFLCEETQGFLAGNQRQARLYEILIQRVGLKHKPELTTLMTAWSFWKSEDEKNAPRMDCVVERLVQWGADRQELLEAAMVKNVIGNAWALGRELFGLGGGETGLKRCAHALVEEGGRDLGLRLARLCSWSRDPSAAFVREVFAPQQAPAPEIIETWLTDEDFSKTTAYPGVLGLARQWAQTQPVERVPPCLHDWLRASKEHQALSEAFAVPSTPTLGRGEEEAQNNAGVSGLRKRVHRL